MNGGVIEIPVAGLVLAFVPVVIVIAILYRWSAGAPTAIYATARMLGQLLLIGFVLVHIFETEHPIVILGVLLVMLVAASWIAIRPLHEKKSRSFMQAFAAIAISGVLTLGLISQAVIGVDPWFSPRYVVPLAGMIFAGSMNAVSLAAERLQSERHGGVPYLEARRTALQAALIPIVNSLFAVGLVSLPGMMTGQILSGVSPLIAAKYQIVVMAMLFGATGISATLYLVLAKRDTAGSSSR